MLAAYDLGAPANQLEAIYNLEQKELEDINTADRKTKLVEKQDVNINIQNWTEYLGQDKCVFIIESDTGSDSPLGPSDAGTTLVS